MSKSKPKKSLSPEELAREIAHDESQPSKAKKRVKIDNPKGFDDTIGKIANTKPSKN